MTNDIDGNPRPYPKDGKYDIGAIEYMPKLVLWNKLGSIDEVKNGEKGPGFRIKGTPSFEASRYSNGIYFEKGVEYIYTPSYIIDKDKGCIEFWWKPDYDYNKTDRSLNSMFCGIAESFGEMEYGRLRLGIFYRYDINKFEVKYYYKDGKGEGGLPEFLINPQPFYKDDLVHIAFSWDRSRSMEGQYSMALYQNGELIGGSTNSINPNMELVWDSQYLKVWSPGETDTPKKEIIEKFCYQYDKVGNRLAVTNLDGPTFYQYEKTYQLTHANYPDGEYEVFFYDPAGNRTNYNKNGVITHYNYDAEDRLLKAGDAIYHYDPNGNQIISIENGKTNWFEYNEENLLSKFTGDNVTAEYTYGPFGRRIRKTIERLLAFYQINRNSGEAEGNLFGKMIFTNCGHNSLFWFHQLT